MVSKITIFEPHFDGAQFGPASIGSEEPAEAVVAPDESEMVSSSDEGEGPQTTGRSRGRAMLGLGLATFFVFLAVAFARRGRNGGVEEDVEVSFDDRIPAE